LGLDGQVVRLQGANPCLPRYYKTERSGFMIWDAYVCNSCGEEFILKEYIENISVCPICTSNDFEFSYEVELEEK